jgi:hypothetical protein
MPRATIMMAAALLLGGTILDCSCSPSVTAKKSELSFSSG